MAKGVAPLGDIISYILPQSFVMYDALANSLRNPNHNSRLQTVRGIVWLAIFTKAISNSIVSWLC